MKKQRELFDEFKPIPDQKSGRDELNLAEFPLAALTERLPKGTKTLEFNDEITDKSSGKLIKREVTITGSDKYGLPKANDDEIITALIQLTRRQGFRSPTVEFSRYEIIDILGWKHTTYSYKRIEESLNRWLGVTLLYKNAWWLPKQKAWSPKEGFHIINNLKISKGTNRKDREAFVWNDTVFSSFKDQNLKVLDLEVYNQLKNHLAKRLYRLIDKRFKWHPKVEFELSELLCKKFGMWKGQPVAALKRHLTPAIDDLVSVGFIEELPKAERFKKQSKGKWGVIFTKQKDQSSDDIIEVDNEFSEIHLKLRKHGISERMVVRLTSKYSPEHIIRKIDILEYLQENDKSKIKYVPGYLLRSIEENYSPPSGWKPEEERAADSKEKDQKQSAQKRQEDLRIITETIEAIKILLEEARVERVGTMAAAMDKMQEAKLLRYLRNNMEDLHADDDPGDYNLRGNPYVEPPKGKTDMNLTAPYLSQIRHEFFATENPAAFESITPESVLANNKDRIPTRCRPELLEEAIREVKAIREIAPIES